MIRSRRLPVRLLVAAAAGAGLVGGHLLGYFVVVRDGHVRHNVLAETGHGYFPEAILVASGCALLAAVSWAILGYRSSLERGVGPPPFRSVAPRLAVLQSVGFVLMEWLERLASGAPIGHLTDPVVVGGILLQVVVALVGAALLVLIGTAAGAVARALSRRVPGRQSVLVAIRRPAWAPRDLFLFCSGQIRGPPLLLAPQL